jgi:phenylpropionate dioxygenase-like ring-hydroxylating dioxygenase large terminal subunit
MNAPMLDREGVDDLPLTLDDDGFMAAELYRSAAVYELEMRHVFPHSWIYVGDLSDLQNPGDYVTETIGYEPVVVVRDRDGALRAFSNVCTHRASVLVDGAGNCGRTMTCPYHGWSFGLDGRLLGVPYQSGFAGGIDKASLGLHELRVDSWERFVFVNVSGDAPPLLEWLHPLPEQLAHHGLAESTLAHALDDDVDVSWKVMIDNAYCDYHLGFVHGSSIGPYADASTIREDHWRTTGRIATTWSAEQLTTAGVRPGITGEGAVGALAYSVFPNWFIAAFPTGGAMVLWWTPTGFQRTRARIRSYAHDAAIDPRADAEMLRAIQDEDFAICRRVQTGIRSGRYRPGPRHQLELRIRGFQRLLLEMLKDALDGRRSS